MVNNLPTVTTVEGVRCYVDINNVAWLNVEDVSRGLGFTHKETKNGVEYSTIRWATVNNYLHEFGFANKVAKDDFIPENMFYRLAMKASNAAAQAFQAKVADDILPSIRKTGFYATKPMDLADQLMIQAKLNIEVRNRLNSIEGTVQEQGETLKRLQQAHNGMSLRHEMRDNKQQDQLDRHETDITNLQKNVYELLTEKADISQDMDIFISAVVQTYYQYIKDQATQYKTAWKDFYNAITEEAKRPKGYIQSLKTRQRNNLISNGMAKTTAEKRVTGKTIVNNNPDLKTAAISVMTRISEDINAHKEEEEKLL